MVSVVKVLDDVKRGDHAGPAGTATRQVWEAAMRRAHRVQALAPANASVPPPGLPFPSGA